jgi:putative peptidoglycan binding protein
MALFRAVIYASFLGVAGLSYGGAYAQSPDLPPDARPGACYIRNTSPALIETVTEQVLVQPEKRGVDPQSGHQIVIAPAIYRTKTVQKIVRPRQESWIEVVCAKNQSRIFIETLQRALAARGYYRGPVTGAMDDRTRRAIRKVQKSRGINSTEITVDLAESYGLITHRIFNQ